MIVAQGFEAGGHVAGEVTTMALVSCVVDAVAPIPVVAAGGISDARGFVAALALGAQGVMIGTRLIATPEANAHPVYKQNILAAREDQTVRTTLFGFGWPHAPHRTLRTPFVERWLPEEARGSEQRSDEPQIGETKIGGQQLTTDNRPVPYAIFTDPQLGRVGVTEAEARATGRPLKIGKIPMSWVARAIERDETAGLMKMIVDAETDQILGAAILGTEGGELIHVLHTLMLAKAPYTLLKGIYIHPTLAEGF